MYLRPYTGICPVAKGLNEKQVQRDLGRVENWTARGRGGGEPSEPPGGGGVTKKGLFRPVIL